MHRILANLNPLTEYAIGFVSLVGLFFQVVWSRRAVALGPTLLTTLGIFFCFLGIALGLADFDPNDIKSSIPNLLQGIRTSFWVSVSGIGWALTIKLRFAVFGEPEPSRRGKSEGATVNDLANHLRALHGAIAGSGEASLADRLDRLLEAFTTHTERNAEANSKALVELLAAVVRDFNVLMTEQFGDNFSQLNQAVGRLVVWQQQYAEQLNGLIERESAMLESMSKAQLRYTELVDRSSVFVGTVESLDTLLSTLNAERDALTTGLTMLSSLVEKASNGLPHIEETIVEMTQQISRGVQTNQEMLGSVLKSSWQSIQVHNQHLTAILAKSLETAHQAAAAHQRVA